MSAHDCHLCIYEAQATTDGAGPRTQLRREQIAEALEDLETVFDEPGAVGDCSVTDAAVSLASEFVAECSYPEVVRRLHLMAKAEESGRTAAAWRQLQMVRRKLEAKGWLAVGAVAA